MTIQPGETFTFHYVSILIFYLGIAERSATIFTFHYVSILMVAITFNALDLVTFTFHYVSILIINADTCLF